jgi:hypothetical protein
MAIQVDAQSRFNRQSVIMVNDIVTFGKWNRPEWMRRENIDEDDILTFKINSLRAGRPDLIANDLYTRPFLDWVLVMWNSPRNTLGWPKIGEVIEAPAGSIVLPNI